MLHRIRLAMETESFKKMSGEVEIDETLIDGAACFMHKDKRAEMITGRGMVGNTAVFGLLERHEQSGPSRRSA